MYYVLNSSEPTVARKLLDAFVEGKKTWNISMPTFIIPSHKSDVIGSWTMDHVSDLDRLNIRVILPSTDTLRDQQQHGEVSDVTTLEL